MDMLIGNNIKRLRREKNITQEKLAEHLNVSCPAVCKWERNETFPDITMVMPLASYFGVSTDELLGFDAAKNEEKILKHLSVFQEQITKGLWDEAKAVISKAHSEFPNDFRIIHHYMLMLIGGNADNPADTVLAHADELKLLCERVLDECTIDHIRNGAIDIYAKIYKAQGNIPKALEMLDRFPDMYSYTKGQKCEQLFEKNTDEWWYWLQSNIFAHADFLTDKLLKAIWFSANESFDEKVTKSLRLSEHIKEICDEAHYRPGYDFLHQAYGKIAAEYNRIGDYENTGKYLRISLEYAKKFDDFIKSGIQVEHTKPEFKEALRNVSYGNSSLVKTILLWVENTPFYDEFRKTDACKALIKEYLLH